jgi:DNA (cytosine-5)-methyltransferase 1
VMRYISLFDGIGAAHVAWAPLGWEPVAVSEIAPFPAAVVAYRVKPVFPKMVAHGDVTGVDWSQYRGKVDLVAGGPPCQAFSVAGLRRSMDDDRGNLSLAYVRAIHAIDPRWTVTENVPGWLSTKDNAFGCFMGALVGADAPLVPPRGQRWTNSGVVSGPIRTAAWRILDAQFFGVAQRRRRVFVLSVRGSGNWACAEALLPVIHSLSGYPAPRRAAGKAAPTLPSRSTAGGGLGTDFDCDGGLDQAAIAEGSVAGRGEADLLPGLGHVPERAALDGAGRIAACLDASFGRLQGQSGQDARHGHSHLVVAGPGGEDLSHAVSARDAKGHPVTAFAHQQGGSIGLHHSEEVALTVQRHQQQAVVFPFDTTQITSPGNVSNPPAGDTGHPLAAGAHAPAIAFAEPLKPSGVSDTTPTGVSADADAQETRSREVLRALRATVGEEAFTEWGLGVVASLRTPEVLRPEVHGRRIRRAAGEAGCELGNGASPREEAGRTRTLREVREAGCERRTPSGWRLPEQLSRELGACLSRLSHPRASATGFLRGMWQASEGVGLLREALSTLQAVGRPTGHEAQPAQPPLAVRRLTPREAERLQAFPDGYTAIPWRGKPADQCPDGPRYQALGNSWATVVPRWIGERIDAVDAILGGER